MPLKLYYTEIPSIGKIILYKVYNLASLLIVSQPLAQNYVTSEMHNKKCITPACWF